MKAIRIALKVIVALGLFTLIVMLLWNWLVPALFGGPAITYFQSLGLVILSKILFGGFGGGAAAFQRARNRSFWKKFGERMEHMTPEEKEKFKSHMCL
jgi:hypothetical protein